MVLQDDEDRGLVEYDIRYDQAHVLAGGRTGLTHPDVHDTQRFHVKRCRPAYGESKEAELRG